MKGLESGKDRVKKICDVLRKETLEPALTEAERIIAEARAEAEVIIREAKEMLREMEAAARLEIERQRNVFQSSIDQACKQALEALKQMIEEKLFDQELSHLILKQTQEPPVLAAIIAALVGALEKEGIDADLSIYIPAAVPARSVNLLLAKEVLDKLKEKSVLLSDIGGGITAKLHKENITIDISDAALKELVAKYIRKDFREMIFRVI
jgi:V/A-type H+/Na+-transporting ATPase subunit E